MLDVSPHFCLPYLQPCGALCRLEQGAHEGLMHPNSVALIFSSNKNMALGMVDSIVTVALHMYLHMYSTVAS